MYKSTTLGGYNMVVIAVDEKSGCILFCPIKRKTAEQVEQALCKIVGALNRHSHPVKKIVFDSEAVFVAMQDRLSVKQIECAYTPAGLHNKRVERAMRTLKSKMRAIKADLDFKLPKCLAGELLAAAATAINSTPNTRSGDKTTPFELVTGRKPKAKRFRFGQVGMCESRRQDDPDNMAEWGMYVGSSSNVEGHMRIYIPTRGQVYSRRSFTLPPRNPIGSTISAPKEWGFEPRLLVSPVKQETEISDADADHVLRTIAPAPNRVLQTDEKMKPSVSWSGSSPLGLDEPTGEADTQSQGSAPTVHVQGSAPIVHVQGSETPERAQGSAAPPPPPLLRHCRPKASHLCR